MFERTPIITALVNYYDYGAQGFWSCLAKEISRRKNHDTSRLFQGRTDHKINSPKSLMVDILERLQLKIQIVSDLREYTKQEWA